MDRTTVAREHPEREEDTGVYRYPRPSRLTRTAPCVSCGSRERVGDLIEVREDSESLTCIAGDMLCSGCARRHGVEL